jgi:fructose-1,6-bisphosphatase
MSDLISLERLYGQLGAGRASTHTDGDVQKELDVLANDILVSAFRRAPVAAVVSAITTIRNFTPSTRYYSASAASCVLKNTRLKKRG